MGGTKQGRGFGGTTSTHEILDSGRQAKRMIDMFKYLEERNRLTKVISTIALLALVLEVLPLNPVVTYASKEERCKRNCRMAI
jgi:hypothetical protein